jgi:hypothetical protein
MYLLPLYFYFQKSNLFSGASNLIAEQCWATPVPQPHSDVPDEQAAYHNIMLVNKLTIENPRKNCDNPTLGNIQGYFFRF